jgi:chromosome segregation ATPase
MAGGRLRRPCCIGRSDFEVRCREATTRGQDRAPPGVAYGCCSGQVSCEKQEPQTDGEVAATEAKKEDLRRQLAAERKDTNRACAEAQAAQAEAKLALAEASLARQRAEEVETRLCGLRDRLEKEETSTRAEVDRTHAQLVDAYRELGAQIAPFKASG